MSSLSSLQLAYNGLSGYVPGTYAALVALRQLDLRGNCALCGAVPVNSMVVTVLYDGTSLYAPCTIFGCKQSFMQSILVGIAVVTSLFLLCMFGR